MISKIQFTAIYILNISTDCFNCFISYFHLLLAQNCHCSTSSDTVQGINSPYYLVCSIQIVQTIQSIALDLDLKSDYQQKEVSEKSNLVKSLKKSVKILCSQRSSFWMSDIYQCFQLLYRCGKGSEYYTELVHQDESVKFKEKLSFVDQINIGG